MVSAQVGSAEGSGPTPAAPPPDEGPELALRESLKWLSVGLSLIYGGFTAHNLRTLCTPGVRWVLAYDIAVIGACAATLVLLGRRRLTLGTNQALGFGLASLLTVNTALSAIALHNPADLAYLPFVVIGSGATLFHFRWLLATFAVSLASAAYAIWRLQSGEVLVFTAASLSAAGVGAAVFVLARRRSQAHIDELRRKERERANELEHALARLEEELAERERGEEERQLLHEQLRRSQQLDSLGVLAGGVAHDMNNVLGAISALASAALDDIASDHTIRGDLEQILTATARGGALTRNLLGFARKGQQVRERVNMNDLVGKIARRFERTAPKELAVRAELDDRIDDVLGDPDQLGQVLMNLCQNGMEAIPAAGTLTIRTKRLELEQPADNVSAGSYVSVSVTDDGEGMSADVVARAFEPFFTTKDSTSHSGLGLSLVYGTLRQHNGRVRISSPPGRGTTVTLDLPSRPAQRAPRTATSTLAPARGRQPETVLLVDDDPLLRAAGRRLLSQLGLKSLDARDGREAVELFRKHRSEISLVILDVAMPVMDGIECFWELRKLDGSIRVLLSSGFPKGSDLDDLFAAGAVGYLAKPYDKAPFARAIAEVLST